MDNMQDFLRLNLQFFGEDTEQSWGEYITEQLSSVEEPVDEQPEQDSEEVSTEEVEEPTEHEVEPDSEEETSEEEESEEQEEEQPLFTDDTEIELGDGKQPVKLSELKNGYLRQSDYTKKTQALAEERKELETTFEQIKPVQEWLGFVESNPYLFQEVNRAISEWNNTGILPLDEVMENASAGKYINHLMVENKRLSDELNRISGEYQTTKLDSEMNTVMSELKAEYGDLLTDDYANDLRKQAEEQGLSMDLLKRLAKGDLAEQKLKQEQENAKKIKRETEVKTIQKQREKRVPPQPKKVGSKPAKQELDYSNMSWAEIARAVAPK